MKKSPLSPQAGPGTDKDRVALSPVSDPYHIGWAMAALAAVDWHTLRPILQISACTWTPVSAVVQDQTLFTLCRWTNKDLPS